MIGSELLEQEFEPGYVWINRLQWFFFFLFCLFLCFCLCVCKIGYPYDFLCVWISCSQPSNGVCFVNSYREITRTNTQKKKKLKTYREYGKFERHIAHIVSPLLALLSLSSLLCSFDCIPCNVVSFSLSPFSAQFTESAWSLKIAAFYICDQ